MRIYGIEVGGEGKEWTIEYYVSYSEGLVERVHRTGTTPPLYFSGPYARVAFPLEERNLSFIHKVRLWSLGLKSLNDLVLNLLHSEKSDAPYPLVKRCRVVL